MEKKSEEHMAYDSKRRERCRGVDEVLSAVQEREGVSWPPRSGQGFKPRNRIDKENMEGMLISMLISMLLLL